ncbi:MAG: SGNH/GDSL hydrolase family protein [Panacagrimonas sp.]
MSLLLLSFNANAADATTDKVLSDKTAEASGPVLTPGPVVTPADPWAEAIAAFASADEAQPRTGGVVFVGSSSIRLWSDLENQFKNYSAVNRGFGGSTMAACLLHMDRLVLPHKPRLVVIYAGDNDLAEGRTPKQVVDDFIALSGRIHERLPRSQIAFVSIKPSPARADLLGRIRDTNTQIRDYIGAQPWLSYVDVFTPMLDAKGQPRNELFLGDSLHLNERGYALWQSLISPLLPLDEQPVPVKNETNTATLPLSPGATPAEAEAPKPAIEPEPKPEPESAPKPEPDAQEPVAIDATRSAQP